MRAPPPLQLSPRVSRQAIALIAATHLASAALVLALPLPAPLTLQLAPTFTLSLAQAWPAKAGAVFLVTLFGAYAVRGVAGAGRPVELRVGMDRRIAIRRRDGRAVDGDIVADSYVGGRLATIVYRPDGARCARSLLMLADNLSPEDFRRLRVVLRYGRAPVAAEARREEDAG